MPLTVRYASPSANAETSSGVDALRFPVRRALLIIVGVELALLFAPTIAWLVDRWTLSVWHNAHGLFVPPVAAWLAWQELRQRSLAPSEGSAWGFLLVIPALGIHAIDAGLHTQLLSAVALFLALPGLALLVLGRAGTRAIAFPLAFLGFAIPIPLALTESLHLLLRQIAAHGTAFLMPAFGVNVFLEGTLLHTPGGLVSVSDACSGFSTLYAALAVGVLAAHGATSMRRKLLVLAAAAPLAIAANLLRVLALTLLVVWSGPELLETFIHPLSGMLTFALALPVIFWLGGAPETAVTR